MSDLKPARKPRKTTLTKTGMIFVVGSVLLYLASLTSQSGLLLFPIGILLGCFVFNLFQARHVLQSVEVEAPELVRVEEGERSRQPWKIRNAGQRDIGMFRIMHEGRILIRLGQMKPGSEVSLIPEVVFEKRGVHAWADLSLECFFPFGLLRVARPLAVAGKAVVHPAVYPCPVPPAAGFDVMVGGKFSGGRQTTSGTHFAGIRPSHPGDPLKHIHWKSSSKGLGLMTRTYDEELSGRLSVLLELSLEKNVDDALRAAGSIIFAALDEGHHVEVVFLGNLDHRVLPPFTDGQEILDMLAFARKDEGLPSGGRFREAVEKVSRRSALVVVLTSDPSECDEAVSEVLAEGRVVTLLAPAATEDWGQGGRVWRYRRKEVFS